jgi:hypothetical protein
MPDAVFVLDVLTVEVDELLRVGGQLLVDMQLTVLCIHDAEAIAVLAEHIFQEVIGENGRRRLFNE